MRQRAVETAPTSGTSGSNGSGEAKAVRVRKAAGEREIRIRVDRLILGLLDSERQLGPFLEFFDVKDQPVALAALHLMVADGRVQKRSEGYFATKKTAEQVARLMGEGE